MPLSLQTKVVEYPISIADIRSASIAGSDT